MTPPPVRGSLPLGGGHDLLPRGSIRIAEPRELVAAGSAPGAYEPNGEIAPDTLRASVKMFKLFNRMPEKLNDVGVEATHEEEVVWGGVMIGHYGHFLTESVTRLWPIVRGAALEGLPVVFTGPANASFARDWLEAFGARTIFLPKEGAVRFRQMFVPEQSWRVGAWIAPELRDTHLHSRRGFDISPAAQHDVLWLSRSRLGRERVAYDEGLLEWLLRDRLTVISPETLTLAEQVSALEGSRAVAGTIGSAFHTLLLTADSPDCLYLCPRLDKGNFPAQHWLLDGTATFVHGLDPAAQAPRMRRDGFIFPGGHRFLIPETLTAFDSTVLPGLLDDPRLAAIANPERRKRHGSLSELDRAVVDVLLEPFSGARRMRLGDLLEEHGFTHCAAEQFAMVADLREGDAQALLRAARLLHLDGESEEASTMAKQALAIDPEVREAADYVT